MGRILRRMWLFNFDSARFAIEVVPVIIRQPCVSICFSLSCGQGVVTFFIFAPLVGGKMFHRLCFIIYFYYYFFWYVWDLSILIFCDMSDHIPCQFFVLFYPFLLDFFMTWILLLYFFLVCHSFFDFLVIFFLSRNIIWWQFSFNSFELLNHS